jgi:hypothetical protein
MASRTWSKSTGIPEIVSVRGLSRILPGITWKAGSYRPGWSVTDEQVKIELYQGGLHDLRKLCETSPTGARWAYLTDLVQYATLQWLVIQVGVSRWKK